MALYKKDFSVVDIGWGLSFLVIFLSGYINSPNLNMDFRTLLIGLLTFIWSIRLSGYILLRSKIIGKEDFRYAQWRKEWGKNANLIAYFKVFILQGVISIIIASPLYLIHFYKSEIPFGNWLDGLGLFLWIIGFMFEAIGDYQKHHFKKNANNKGKILKEGLWGYTRHPNYFGEALLWWGIFLMAINQLPFYFAVIGPLLLHIFLLKVSGVAMLEKKYESNKEYEIYKKSINAFIPWFPRESK